MLHDFSSNLWFMGLFSVTRVSHSHYSRKHNSHWCYVTSVSVIFSYFLDQYTSLPMKLWVLLLDLLSKILGTLTFFPCRTYHQHWPEKSLWKCHLSHHQLIQWLRPTWQLDWRFVLLIFNGKCHWILTIVFALSADGRNRVYSLQLYPWIPSSSSKKSEGKPTECLVKIFKFCLSTCY